MHKVKDCRSQRSSRKEVAAVSDEHGRAVWSSRLLTQGREGDQQSPPGVPGENHRKLIHYSGPGDMEVVAISLQGKGKFIISFHTCW